MKSLKGTAHLAAAGLIWLTGFVSQGLMADTSPLQPPSIQLTSSQLQSSQHTQQQPWLLAKYDLNGDTTITLEEVSEKKKSLFVQLDHDRDGHISFGEYETIDQAKRQALLKKRFSKLDEDKNGRVSEAEYASFVGLFSTYDSDGDGTLSRGEVHSYQNSNSVNAAPNTHCLLWFCIRSEL
ncbi:EF-hand domain-containing protein [Pseudomaricurvus sp.]|uniref:EF-hand domain-containing protein n=1 Tax=Pseudomaricurvus sp. TaxID=2004510 RepID=UPI003F6CD45D